MKIKMKFLFSLFAILLFISCSENEVTIDSINEKVNAESIDPKLQKARFGREIIEAYVPHISSSVRASSKINLSYELNIANTFRLPMELLTVGIFDTENQDQPLAVFDIDYILKNLQRPGLTGEQNENHFEGGQFGILNLWLELEESKVPKKIFHKLHFNLDTGNGEMIPLEVEKALFDFPSLTQVTLDPPFRDGNWFYYTIGHNNTRELTEGKASYAQRFAIDWAFIGEDGTFANGDKTKNESFLSYGKELLAVANGVVVEIQDSIPDNEGESLARAVKIDRYNSSGNHLILDIGNDVHVIYAHLIPHSFKVKVGDQVKSGDVLGLLGNSGESTGPHLHMHVETKNKLLLGGEGLPYHFNKYSEIVSFDPDINLDSLFSGDKLLLGDSIIIKESELPIGIGVVKFGE